MYSFDIIVETVKSLKRKCSFSTAQCRVQPGKDPRNTTSSLHVAFVGGVEARLFHHCTYDKSCLLTYAATIRFHVTVDGKVREFPRLGNNAGETSPFYTYALEGKVNELKDQERNGHGGSVASTRVKTNDVMNEVELVFTIYARKEVDVPRSLTSASTLVHFVDTLAEDVSRRQPGDENAIAMATMMTVTGRLALVAPTVTVKSRISKETLSNFKNSVCSILRSPDEDALKDAKNHLESLLQLAETAAAAVAEATRDLRLDAGRAVLALATPLLELVPFVSTLISVCTQLYESYQTVAAMKDACKSLLEMAKVAKLAVSEVAKKLTDTPEDTTNFEATTLVMKRVKKALLDATAFAQAIQSASAFTKFLASKDAQEHFKQHFEAIRTEVDFLHNIYALTALKDHPSLSPSSIAEAMLNFQQVNQEFTSNLFRGLFEDIQEEILESRHEYMDNSAEMQRTYLDAFAGLRAELAVPAGAAAALYTRLTSVVDRLDEALLEKAAQGGRAVASEDYKAKFEEWMSAEMPNSFAEKLQVHIKASMSTVEGYVRKMSSDAADTQRLIRELRVMMQENGGMADQVMKMIQDSLQTVMIQATEGNVLFYFDPVLAKIKRFFAATPDPQNTLKDLHESFTRYYNELLDAELNAGFHLAFLNRVSDAFVSNYNEGKTSDLITEIGVLRKAKRNRKQWELLANHGIDIRRKMSRYQGQEVIIKKVATTYENKNFVEEAASLLPLDGESALCLPRFHGVVARDTFHFVFEHVKGKSLADAPAMATKQKLESTRHLLAALNALHLKSMVHGCICLKNIVLLTTRVPHRQSAPLVLVGGCVGTGKGGPPADMHALAVTLHCLWTNIQDLPQNTLVKDTVTNANYPRCVKEVILGCMCPIADRLNSRAALEKFDMLLLVAEKEEAEKVIVSKLEAELEKNVDNAAQLKQQRKVYEEELAREAHVDPVPAPNSTVVHSIPNFNSIPYGATHIKLQATRSIGHQLQSGLYQHATVKAVDLSECGCIEIGNRFGSEWTALETVVFGSESSVTKIGTSFLSGCTKLLSIDLSNVKLLSAVGESFMQNCSISEVSFGASMSKLTSFPDYFCSSAEKLVNVELTSPSAATEINARFFYRCSNLISVKLTGLKKLTKIGDQCMENCQNLTSVEFGTCMNLKKIGNDFLLATAISTFSFLQFSQLEKFGDRCFFDCVQLKEIDVSFLTMLNSVGKDFGGDARKTTLNSTQAALFNKT